MKVKFLNKGQTLVAKMIGELDHHSAEYVRQKIDNELLKASNKNIIFDFGKVSFMDSSGLGVIIGRYKKIQKLEGKAAIINLDEHIRRILDISGIFKIIPEYDSIDVATNKM